MTTVRIDQRVGAERETDLATWLGGVLALVAALELVILRTGTRTVIHIPGIEAFEIPFRAMSTIGRSAYYVSVVLVIVSLTLAAVSLATRRALGSVFALIALFAGATAARAGLLGGDAVAGLTAVVVVALGVRLSSRACGWQRLVLVLLVAAPTVALLGVVLVEADGSLAGAERVATTVGEALAVAAALATPLLVYTRRPKRSSWIAAGITGVLVLMMLVGAGGATTRILMLWNFGLSGYFADPLYALAAAAVAFTIAQALSSGRSGLAAGLALLLTGGIGAHSTYQSALVVVGFCVLEAAMAERGAGSVVGPQGVTVAGRDQPEERHCGTGDPRVQP